MSPRIRTLARTVWVCLVADLLGCGGGGDRAVSARPDHPRPEGALVVAGAAGRYGGRYVASHRADPKTWNSIISNESTTTEITNGMLFESLIAFDHETQENEPALAESWTSNEDGTVWTIRLRRGLRWSDGAPLGADDVLFTAGILYDEKIHPTVSDLCRVRGEPFRFEKIDDTTLRVTLAGPYGPFLTAIGSIYVLPRHKLEAAYLAGTFESTWGTDTDPAEIVSSGPWVLAEYVPQTKVVLRPNPHYYKFDPAGNRLPYLDEIVYVIVPDQNAELLRFRGGETDEFYFRAEDYAMVKDGEAGGDYGIYELGTEMGTQMLWFNQNPGRSPADGKPYVDPAKLRIFRDFEFRRAVAHAVDREAISRTVYLGKAEPLYGPIPPANRKWAYPGVARYEFDLDLARDILDGAGYRDRDGDGVREDPRGTPLAFTLLTGSDNKERTAIAMILTEDLAAIGIRCNLSPLEFNAVTTKLGKTYDYEAALLGLTGGIPPDPVMSQNVFKSSGRTHFWNPQQAAPATAWEASVDSLMELQIGLSDESARKAVFDQVQRIVTENLPMIYTVSRPAFLALRREFSGVHPTVLRPWVLWRSETIHVRGEGGRAGAPGTGGDGQRKEG